MTASNSPRIARTRTVSAGDDTVHIAFDRQLHGAFDGEAAQLSRLGHPSAMGPLADRLGDGHSASFWANHHNVTALANPWVSERFGDDLRSNSAGISHSHGKTRFHFLHPE